MSETIVISPEQSSVIEVKGFIAQANSLVITSNAQAQLVSDLNGELAARIKKVEEVREEIIEPARTSYEKYKKKADAYCDPAIEDMTKAKSIHLTKIGVWQQEEGKRIAAANAVREKAEREARQKAEKEAAAKIAAARAKTEELEVKAREAEEKGNVKAQAKAAADIAKIQEDVHFEVEELHTKATAIQAPVEAPVKIAGMTMKTIWTAEIDGFDEKTARMKLIKAAAGDRPDLAAYLAVDMKALNGIARAMKANFAVPGFKAVDTMKVSGARRK